MTGVFIKRGHLDQRNVTGRKPCEDEGRGWADAFRSQGTSEAAYKPPEVQRVLKWLSLTASEGTNSTGTLTLDS